MSHILVVDDNEENLYLTRFLMEKDGHSIDVASNGEQAIEMVKQNNFDLVLMDIQMPVIDGLEATRQLVEQGGHVVVSQAVLCCVAGELLAGFSGEPPGSTDPDDACATRENHVDHLGRKPILGRILPDRLAERQQAAVGGDPEVAVVIQGQVVHFGRKARVFLVCRVSREASLLELPHPGSSDADP